MEANPILLKSRWLEAKTNEGKTYGSSTYSILGGYVYRRRSLPQKGFEYSRIAYTKIYSLHHWYEIDETLWEPVDVYGFQLIR